TFDLCGEPVGVSCVGKQCVMLCQRDAGFGIQVVLERIERNLLQASAHFRFQLRLHRGVERQQKFQLGIGVQTRRLIDVDTAAACDKVIDSAAEKERKI